MSWSPKDGEVVDVAGHLIDLVLGALHESAVPFDPLPMLVPGSSDVAGELRPPRHEFGVLRLGPEHQQRGRGVFVAAVGSGRSPARRSHLVHYRNLQLRRCAFVPVIAMRAGRR